MDLPKQKRTRTRPPLRPRYEVGALVGAYVVRGMRHADGQFHYDVRCLACNAASVLKQDRLRRHELRNSRRCARCCVSVAQNAKPDAPPKIPMPSWPVPGPVKPRR